MTDLEWDESTRPEFVPTGTAGEYSPFERARSQELVRIHDHLRRELEQLLELVGQVRDGALDVGRALFLRRRAAGRHAALAPALRGTFLLDALARHGMW